MIAEISLQTTGPLQTLGLGRFSPRFGPRKKAGFRAAAPAVVGNPIAWRLESGDQLRVPTRAAVLKRHRSEGSEVFLQHRRPVLCTTAHLARCSPETAWFHATL